MVSDARAQRAREEHRASRASLGDARAHRDNRDRLVRALRAEDPQLWTYVTLGRAIGCSPELIAHIVREGA